MILFYCFPPVLLREYRVVRNKRERESERESERERERERARESERARERLHLRASGLPERDRIFFDLGLLRTGTFQIVMRQ